MGYSYFFTAVSPIVTGAKVRLWCAIERVPDAEK
jgi:hypothetical protein